jgi:hypothetical protein
MIKSVHFKRDRKHPFFKGWFEKGKMDSDCLEYVYYKCFILNNSEFLIITKTPSRGGTRRVLTRISSWDGTVLKEGNDRSIPQINDVFHRADLCRPWLAPGGPEQPMVHRDALAVREGKNP